LYLKITVFDYIFEIVLSLIDEGRIEVLFREHGAMI